MKTCNKCHIVINTTHSYCPICHQVLVGEIDESGFDLYPSSPESQITINKTMQRLIIFISLLAMVILTVVDLLDNSGNYWSLLTNAVILYSMLSVQFSVYARTRSASKIFGLGLLLMILILVINLLLEPGNLWALDYVIPSIILANNITLLMIIMIKRHGMQEEGKHYVASFITSIIPIVLYLFDIIKDPTVALILFAFEVTTIFFMIIFFPKALKDILKKIFHF